MSTDFDLTPYQDPLRIQQALLDAKTIAIVGLSADPLRASNFVGFYLQRHGYRVIPVNPKEAEILGEKLPHNAAEDSFSILPDLLGTAKGPLREATVSG